MTTIVRLLVVALISLATQASSLAAGVTEPLSRPALMSRVAAQSVLTAVAKAGERLVAVGEHGIVLLSDDAGQNWRQAGVPVSVTLTAVSFPTAKQGWAVGHYGVVLHSEDGGETWVRQLDGIAVGKLAMESAEALANGAAAADLGAGRALADAQRLVKDGADKPFLDLYFENERRGFVVGAYNLAFRTEDGGKTWRYWGDRLDNPKANHLYAIRALGEDVYLAGEQGLVLHSGDGGKSFAKLETPYNGSYFALALFPSGEIVVAGLRGNAYRSADHGATWKRVETPTPASISSLKLLADGSLLVANQAGQILISRDRGESLQTVPLPPLAPVNDVETLRDGGLLTVGLRGATRVSATAGTDGGKH